MRVLRSTQHTDAVGARGAERVLACAELHARLLEYRKLGIGSAQRCWSLVNQGYAAGTRSAATVGSTAAT